MMGKIHEEFGIGHIRLTAENSDMYAKNAGADLWGSLPRSPWSNWQNMCVHLYGESYKKKLHKNQRKSLRMLENYLAAAEKVLAQGGHVAFEWPKNCAGWSMPKLIKFIKRHNLFEATFDGCDFGLVDSEGKPHRKPWRAVTSSSRLAKNLKAHKRKHPHDFVHSQVAGNKTALTAHYPEAMVRCVAA